MRVPEAKVVILGAQGVGKTSFIHRYVGQIFEQHTSPTIGASFFTCNINVDEHELKLLIWDTAGQERFRCMAPMYYRKANAAILMFDITSYESFESMKTWILGVEGVFLDIAQQIIKQNETNLRDGNHNFNEGRIIRVSSVGNYERLHNEDDEEKSLLCC